MKPQLTIGNFLWIIAVCIAAFVIIIPLFNTGFITTDDGSWMVIRLSAFYQSLREGQFPVRYLGRLNNSYGYPIANFLYPGYLYIGSFFHFIGFSFIDSIKIIFGGSLIIGGIFIFLWLRKLTSATSAFVGTLSYLFAPYLFFDLYKRGSVGEILALTWAAAGLYAIEAKNNVLLAPVLFLLIISHNSLGFLFVLLFFSIFLLRRNIHALLSLALGLGMASFFWFPALYEKMYVNFDSTHVSNPLEYFAQGNLFYLLSASGLLALLWFVVVKPQNISRTYVISYIGFTIFATPLSQLLWGINGFSKFFQFPFRMLAGSMVFGAYLVAIMIEKSTDKYRYVFIILIFVISLWQIKDTYNNIIYTNYPDGYYSTNEATTTVSNEYMPKWVKEMTTERPTERMIFQKGRGTINFKTASTQKIDAEVTVIEESILQINSIYYPGWGVLVDNIPVKISYDNPNGVMRFPIHTGNHNVFVEFRETIPRFIADCFSLFSFALYIQFIVRMGYLKKRSV